MGKDLSSVLEDLLGTQEVKGSRGKVMCDVKTTQLDKTLKSVCQVEAASSAERAEPQPHPLTPNASMVHRRT